MTNDPTDPHHPEPDSPTTFVRHELKLVLSQDEALRVVEWCGKRFEFDSHGDGEGRYDVQTLYLDSPGLEIYHRTGEARGTKFRVRRYGSSETLWLERKRRRGSKVNKLRAEWRHDALEALFSGRAKATGFAGEFQDVVEARGLRPVLLVTYPRSAFGGAAGERVTLDWGVKVWKSSPGEGVFDPTGEAAVVTDDVILELKYDDVAPPAFEELLALIGRDPASFSKYGRGVEVVGLAHASRREGDDA